MDSPLQPVSDRLDPTPSTAPPSTLSPTTQTPPVTPALACRCPSPAANKPSSAPPPPLHHHQSILPPCRLAPRALHHRPDGFCRQAAGADGGGSLPCFSIMGQKGIWARLTCHARPSTSADPSPLQQCHFVFFHSNYSNSILIKVQTS
jgi:hypothetical protein